MPRSATPALEASSAAVPGPSPRALKTPSSTPAFSAALRWCAVIVSQMSVGFGSDIHRIISNSVVKSARSYAGGSQSDSELSEPTLGGSRQTGNSRACWEEPEHAYSPLQGHRLPGVVLILQTVQFQDKVGEVLNAGVGGTTHCPFPDKTAPCVTFLHYVR